MCLSSDQHMHAAILADKPVSYDFCRGPLRMKKKKKEKQVNNLMLVSKVW